MTEMLTKKVAGNIFEMMGLVKDNRLVSWKNFTKPSLLQGQIRKEEVMVYDKKFGRPCPLTQTVHEAELRLRTLAPKALSGLSRDFWPQRGTVGKPGQFSPISNFCLI